ncbi:MAG: hypothetical protein IT493_02830 [Gammaproteobacteria bacterium]|nr:hypothetical protein [Gammaproteobacteria bacterium]
MKKLIRHTLSLLLLASSGLPFAAGAGGGTMQPVHGAYYGPPAYSRPYPYAYAPRPYYAPPAYGYRYGRGGYAHRNHDWHRHRGWRGDNGWRGRGGWNSGYGGYGGYGGPRSGFSFYFSD